MRKYNKERKRLEKIARTPMTGNKVSHSKIHTKRKFHPNLQTAVVILNGVKVRLRMRAKDIKTLNKLD